MNIPGSVMRWLFWSFTATLVLAVTIVLWWYSQPPRRPAHASTGVHNPKDKEAEENDDAPEPAEPPSVRVVRPRAGAISRLSIQAGSVEADEVHVHSMVTGMLKEQPVLIGQRVKRGQPLALIDVPELEVQVRRNAALVEQANARVTQMEAKVSIANADLEAAKAQIIYSEANARAATAWVSYRFKSFQRMKDLFATRSIEERLEDEAKERFEAAKESESAAKSAIVTSKAQALSSQAKIHLAEADVGEAKAQVRIAEADLTKSQVLLGYAQIVAPFDGIITQRNYYRGATVRAIGDKGSQAPLLTIQRTDMMRVVVQVPDNDARYADAGDPAYIEIDAFRGVKFDAIVSRIADTEDPQTRLMRVEIDLPNPQGRIRQGMYGKVTILLDKEKDKLSIPALCRAHGKSHDVFVVRDGKAHLTRVVLGLESSERVMVLQGLEKEDKVILNPPSSLRDGAEVQSADWDEVGHETANQR